MLDPWPKGSIVVDAFAFWGSLYRYCEAYVTYILHGDMEP